LFVIPVLFAGFFEGILAMLVCWVFQFVFITIAVVLIKPLDKDQKGKIIENAKSKIQEWKEPKKRIIAIAGSYGKTSMKDAITTVLSQKYRVLATSGNENTPLGIARMVSEKLDPTIDILICELGEYVPGDIEELCEMITPDIGIITGINEAHLERMGDLKNTIGTIFELAHGLRDSSLLLLNADDENVIKNYMNHCEQLDIKFYSKSNNPICEWKFENNLFLESQLSFAGDLTNNQVKIPYKIQFIANYSLGLAMATTILGLDLNMNSNQIIVGLDKMRPAEHRLNAIPGQKGIIVIDDTYNGNPDGVVEAVESMQNFKNRRKVLITPGLVELGPKSQNIHYNLGQTIGSKIEALFVIVNENTEKLIAGATESNPELAVKKFYSTKELHGSLGTTLIPGDVALFQNDLTDNY
jgi:UDP-N-acetylmuramoyl-tripeptide--D-alanyl-D-alanine ligase